MVDETKLGIALQLDAIVAGADASSAIAADLSRLLAVCATDATGLFDKLTALVDAHVRHCKALRDFVISTLDAETRQVFEERLQQIAIRVALLQARLQFEHLPVGGKPN